VTSARASVARFLSLLIVARISCEAMLAPATTLVPKEMEWNSSRKWQAAVIADDVLITVIRGRMTGYRLPSLEKRWERNVRPKPVDRFTSEGPRAFLRDVVPRDYLTAIEPPTGCEDYQIAPAPRPGGAAFTITESAILVEGRGTGVAAHAMRGGSEIWRAPMDCKGTFEFSGGLQGRVLATCRSDSSNRALDLVSGRSDLWPASFGPGDVVFRCPDARNLDGAIPEKSASPVAECLSGSSATRAGTQDVADEGRLHLRGFDRRGRVLWQTRAPGHFRDLSYVDPGRAVLQTDAGMRLVRTADGKELGAFADSANCQVYGAYGGKLVSKVIGEGTVKIHDLETRSLLSTVGEGTVGQTIVARGSPYLVLLEETGAVDRALPSGYWLVYRMGERGAREPLTMVGRIAIPNRD